MNSEKLTGRNFWETYWETDTDNKKKKRPSLCVQEILKAFDSQLPAEKGLKALEIGGAKGEYLLYLVRRFGYDGFSLDYSSAGNEQTLETFSRAGYKVQVYERDLFADNSDLPLFDIVFSLGFIEHFEDPASVVESHLRLLRPGGVLLLGVPNYSGIYHLVLKHLAPSMYKTHNLRIMDLSSWSDFEQKFGLETLYRAYIGGFEPLNMKKLENRNLLNRLVYFKIQVLTVLFSFRFRGLRKFNSAFISSYLIGIYRKNK
ncbi:MAG: class I SAM-dependent methyltransferase [Bacteroidetes bacterium]|nr:class I SAM-dependent methyltransferase [Bacteroidota bacterium]